MYKRLYPKYFEEPMVPNTGFRLQTHEVPTSTKIPIVTQENNSHGDKPGIYKLSRKMWLKIACLN